MLSVNCGFDETPQGQKLLIHYGPTIAVHIGFDPIWKSHVNAPPALSSPKLRALIDTGARESCVDSELAMKLGLPHFDRRPVSSVSGKVVVDFHVAQVHVPSLRFTQSGPFAAVPLIASGFKFEALLGRSFLSYVQMTYDGVAGSVTVSFK